MKENSPHLSFEEIVDIAVGDRNDDATTEHLISCPQCAMERSRTGQLVDLMRTDQTEDAPAFALASILRAFDEFRPDAPDSAKLSVGQRLRAIIQLDSAQHGPAYGFRSTGVANSRQLLLSADNGSLDIRITPVDAKWIISGQVLGQITGGTVSLDDETISLSAEIDSRGEFSLPPIPLGTYRLRLDSDSFDVEVPDLVIG